MTKCKSISILILSALASFGMAVPAMAASGGVPITAVQVANAITGSGMKVSPQQVTLPDYVVATTSNPILQVESVQPWGDHRLSVRLSCASTDQCVPFLVAVRWGESDAVQPAVATPKLRPAALVTSRPTSFVVHAGSPAVLLLDSDHVHIRISVVCLENGAPGQTIRVQTKDHTQTFEAQVQDAAY